MKKQKYYTIGMDIKLKSAEELFKKYHRNPFETSPDIVNKNILKAIKEAQRNAIEVAVQRCRQDAKMTYNFYEDESYIDIISILGCKQKLFEENNLI